MIKYFALVVVIQLIVYHYLFKLNKAFLYNKIVAILLLIPNGFIIYSLYEFEEKNSITYISTTLLILVCIWRLYQFIQEIKNS
ncbi:MAG: hypothetical protein RIR12_2037 [Bacteroidota bacterium]|jgi:hypothetical protein